MPADKRPGWYRWTRFLGRPPALTERQWRVLGLVSAVSFFEQYDLYLFALNLARIQSSLGIDDAQLGFLGSAVRAGALFAIVVTTLADRVGRRRMLLVTVLMYTLLTGLTALAPDAATFVALQFLARVFAVAETLLAAVVIVEEFPPAHRGWGIGAFGAIQACGAGAAALLFAFVDVLPFGWRAMYALGVLPLLLIARWRLLMPETERFAALAASPASAALPGVPEVAAMPGTQGLAVPLAPGALAASVALLGRLLREAGGRFAAVATTLFLMAFSLSGVALFQVKYMLDVHGWSPPMVSALTVAGGGLAILANPLAGRWSDRFGRRRLACVFLLAAGASAAGFYGAAGIAGLAPALGFVVGVLWIAFLFAQFGADTALVTYASEVFPTSLRSTANGARMVVTTLGNIGGLAAVSLLYPLFGSNWQALAWLPLGCIGAAVVVWFTFIETAGRSLEAIAPEPPH